MHPVYDGYKRKFQVWSIKFLDKKRDHILMIHNSKDYIKQLLKKLGEEKMSKV